MTRLLIVDDENYLVESMLSSIPWEMSGVTDVAGAYSANEALALLEEDDFDIVITDVKMPEMDGLELTAAIKKRWKYVKCILLSGYAEFELVKAGLQHEASDYLLKPVRDEVLLARVKELAAVQQREKEQERAYLDSKAFLHQSVPLLRLKLLNDLIFGNHPSQKQLSEQMLRYEIGIRIGDYVSILLIRIEHEAQEPKGTDDKLMTFAVTNILEELLAEGYEQWAGEDLYGHLLFVVKQKEIVAETESLAQIADHLLRIVRKLYKLTVSVIICPPDIFPGCMQSSYQQGVASFRRYLGEERDTIVTIGSQHPNRDPSVLTSLHRLPLFVHLLEAGQWDSAASKLQEVVNEWRQLFDGSYEHLMEIYHSLSADFFYYVLKNGEKITDYHLLSGIKLHTIEDLYKWASELIARLQSAMNDDVSRHRRSLVSQVQMYVQENLGHDLSLQSISEHVHMHPVHLSKVYKNDTGENISDYVLRLRMEQAVTLLHNRELKVYEIAEQVGYKNPAYFIRVFKNHFNVTPQEYRNE
ncbi:response regulator [Paenibacillus arenilitoris]|uniref:Response regulator n=1 Tax=Paenibacillus arenilitoris TaxID=2772299 RepID=A0A927CPB4_9BACL|nr:response regulator [Paenibacillus arenilitoris]MBD2871050.1 response regulator [Paenibacillus arenilitoris]